MTLKLGTLDHSRTPLEELALRLAANHLHLAMPKSLRRAAAKQLLKEPPPLGHRPIVMVIGAGASAGAAGLPLGRDTYRHLLKYSELPEPVVNRQLERLSVQYRLDPEDFETRLLALSHFHRFGVLEALTSIFQRRHYTTFVYEIVAHLLKHRFVDAVVNFNFDELLDQALEDELGPASFRKVISDGDVSDELLTCSRPAERAPLYIKPHGTASHPSSLRFTREDYFLLPTNILRLLSRLIHAEPTTLVTVGFALRSVEFAQIIAPARDRSLPDFFVVDQADSVLLQVPEGATARHVPVSDLNQTFGDLWEAILACFKPGGEPRGIQRHELLSRLFGDALDWSKPDQARLPRTKDYLLDRAIVEVSLAIAKAKGFVNLTQLAMSRAGQYFSHYRALESAPTLKDLCVQLDLIRVGFSHDALRLENLGETATESQIVPWEAWRDRKRNALVEKTIQQLSPERRGRAEGLSQLFKDTFDYMYRSEEVEVVSPKIAHFHALFSQSLELGTLEAMKVYTRDMLQRPDWDCMLCTAESGEWLLKPQIRNIIKDRAIVLIVCDRTYQEELRCYPNIQLRWMPWWMHNQHMTVATSHGHPSRAIYFERRLRSLAIRPVALEDARDVKIAEDMFFAYWVKAATLSTKETTMTIVEKFVRPADLAHEKERVYKWVRSLTRPRVGARTRAALVAKGSSSRPARSGTVGRVSPKPGLSANGGRTRRSTAAPDSILRSRKNIDPPQNRRPRLAKPAKPAKRTARRRPRSR